MGTTSSVVMLYKVSSLWFKNFVDQELYNCLFEELDQNKDGGIDYGELQMWIKKKQAAENSPFHIFNLKTPVIMMAHKMASMKTQNDASVSVAARKQVDFSELRALMIHLFAFSLLWRHFVQAKHWEGVMDDDSKDSALQLSLPEFMSALKGLAFCNAKDQLTIDLMESDFHMMDTNYSNCVGFVTICQQCAKYILPANNPLLREINVKEGRQSVKIPKFFGNVTDAVLDFSVGGTKKIFKGVDVDSKVDMAFFNLGDRIKREEHELEQFYTEMSMIYTHELSVRGSRLSGRMHRNRQNMQHLAVMVLSGCTMEELKELHPDSFLYQPEELASVGDGVVETLPCTSLSAKDSGLREELQPVAVPSSGDVAAPSTQKTVVAIDGAVDGRTVPTTSEPTTAAVLSYRISNRIFSTNSAAVEPLPVPEAASSGALSSDPPNCIRNVTQLQ